MWHWWPVAAQERVPRRIGVQHRGIRAQRLQRIEDRRQVLVVDLDQRHGGLGDLWRFGGDGGDTLADESHAFVGQNRPVE